MEREDFDKFMANYKQLIAELVGSMREKSLARGLVFPENAIPAHVMMNDSFLAGWLWEVDDGWKFLPFEGENGDVFTFTEEAILNYHICAMDINGNFCFESESIEDDFEVSGSGSTC